MTRFIAAGLILLLFGPAGRIWGQGATQREADENIKVLKTKKTVDERKYAIKRLGELEQVRRGVAKEATPLIAAALKDPNADVRLAAVKALGIMLYDPETWAKDLGPFLAEKEKRDVKLAAVTTLGLVGKHGAFALKQLTTMRDKEETKAKKDMDFIRALKTTIAAIQQDSTSMLGPWHYIGPFANDNNAGFKTAYPPEKEIDLKKTYPGKNGTVAKWREGKFTDGEVNDLALFDEADNENAVVYLYREIDSSEAKEMNVSLGSDDTLTVWLNGAKILEEEVYRGAAPDQNKATLKLRPGKNALLIKICQGGGEWAFYFRMMEAKEK
jgi:hypothetical protein